MCPRVCVCDGLLALTEEGRGAGEGRKGEEEANASLRDWPTTAVHSAESAAAPSKPRLIPQKLNTWRRNLILNRWGQPLMLYHLSMVYSRTFNL